MLSEEFPNVDLSEEAKKYLFWVIDQPQEKTVGKKQKWNYRSRFHQWLQNRARKPKGWWKIGRNSIAEVVHLKVAV